MSGGAAHFFCRNRGLVKIGFVWHPTDAFIPRGSKGFWRADWPRLGGGEKWVRLLFFHILRRPKSVFLSQFCGFWPIEIGFVL